MYKYRHSAVDLPLINQIVSNMIVNKWFWFGEGIPKTPLGQELKHVTISKLDKYIKANYIIEDEEIEEIDNSKDWIEKLSQKYKLILLSNTDFHLGNILLLKKQGLFSYFEDFIMYNEKLEVRTLAEH
mmetsp:Transcript_17113/g.15076  ORF Transcript_17113/g.15076 Transcript_17113/m.15076 type:complete len:128 (-) Transcript_17113:1255-1638(-)